jgi:hypothetical protein
VEGHALEKPGLTGLEGVQPRGQHL